ncbi:HAD family hydrolase [Dokdonella sp.]|uniref:HAD family hydrolase n=1 Tax=Dokdonella sp. TaxID=2291710 RepID=UPI0031BCE1D6|nr:haloacid dehalogenase-like hydrolase [Dokdonella sp.]
MFDWIPTLRRGMATMAIAALLALATVLPAAAATGADPLASWNDGATKHALVSFVETVSDPASKDFVPPEKRIAVFDNDGTLWVEQPMYTQIAFALDRVRALAPEHPEWLKNPALKAAIEGNTRTLLASGYGGILELMAVTHAGMTTAAFETIVADWFAKAEHPRFKRKYTDLVYQPMIELLQYLRANGFSTYIVSGGGVEFMRPLAQEVYGIAPPNVIGSNLKTKFEMINGKPALVRLPELGFITDEGGKPVSINLHIGERPIAAFGNSDGDLQMLQWTTAGEGPRLGAIVHHTDAAREYAYDRKSSVGALDKALDAAPANGWIVIDMKTAWKTVFAPVK